MELKEIHILNNTLHGLLTMAAQNTLKQKIGSEKEYAKFLIALLDVVIGKRSSPSLKDILSLLGISHIQNDLQQESTNIIEEIADLHFKGYNSDYTKWLQEHKNETFAIHLAFLKETKSGISQTERDSLKNKLVNIDKIDAFEFEEKDIRSGIKLNERIQLKRHFNELYTEFRIVGVAAPKKRKLILAISILFASSIVFAFVNPSIRHFILKEYHKLIDAPKENDKSSEIKLKSAQALPVNFDTISTKINSVDSSLIKSTLNNKIDNEMEMHRHNKTKHKKDSAKLSVVNTDNFNDENELKTEKYYDAYFNENQKKLNSIEGFWLLNVKDKSNTANGFKMKSAIVRIAKNKFELVHLNNEGNIEKLPYNMYFQLVSVLEGYNFTIQVDNKTTFKSIATLQVKEGLLIFESEYDARHFNPKNRKEMVKCKVNAFKKPNKN